jgi:hypothetical protein
MGANPCLAFVLSASLCLLSCKNILGGRESKGVYEGNAQQSTYPLFVSLSASAHLHPQQANTAHYALATVQCPMRCQNRIVNNIGLLLVWRRRREFPQSENKKKRKEKKRKKEKRNKGIIIIIKKTPKKAEKAAGVHYPDSGAAQRCQGACLNLKSLTRQFVR